MNIDQRTKALYQDKFDKLKDLKVAIIGLGGVGSIIPISLIRTGIKDILLIDKDKVEESNLNRQLGYFKDDINKIKVNALKDNLLKIRDDLNIKIINTKIDENFNFKELDDYLYIIDCVDDINAKILLAKYSINNHKKLVVSLGMGKKFHPELVEITKLNKTYNDPLAKKYRYLLKKENIDISNIVVAFSKEEIKEFDSNLIASSFFVPNEAGLLIAAYIINDYLGYRF